MKKIIPKINFSKEDFKGILSKIICCKRLLFIIFFGMLLIFTFDIVYKYALLDIKYIDYERDDSFLITDGKINNVNLNRVLKNIDKDRERIKTEINKEYKTPFSFDDPELPGEFNEDKKEDENINNSDLDNNKDLGEDKNNESNGVIPFEL